MFVFMLPDNNSFNFFLFIFADINEKKLSRYAIGQVQSARGLVYHYLQGGPVRRDVLLTRLS